MTVILKPVLGTKKCRETQEQGNSPTFFERSQGDFSVLITMKEFHHPAFDNPVGLHWSQAGRVPSQGCKLIVTEGVSNPGFELTSTVIESGPVLQLATP